MKFVETPDHVKAERGFVRAKHTTYGSDGMSVVETGEGRVFTPHAALATGERLIAAATKILREQQAAEELERRRA